MGRPRFHPTRNILTGIVAAGAMILTMIGQAAATGLWQRSWGDYGSHQQWHDADWWLQNRYDWVTVNRPGSTDNYAETRGRMGTYDRLHVWQYGDGGFDHNSTGLTIEDLTKSHRSIGGVMKIRGVCQERSRILGTIESD